MSHNTSMPLWVAGLVGLVVAGALQRRAAAEAPPATQPAKVIVWDGDDKATGGGWVHISASHDKAGTGSFRPQDKEAHNGKKALELRGEVGGWVGGGWNWHAWTPKGSGDDVSDYRNFTFWVKYVGDAKPNALQINISSSGENEVSARLDALKYCADAVDGQWHEVVVPLKDLQAEGNLDPKKAWEFGIGLWLNEGAKFSLFIDEIGFSK